jgi:1,2-diacylglycerol 3-alpha-glucosyltransferase
LASCVQWRLAEGAYLRILMISDVYFPRINGVSTSINTFKDELESLGHQVTLIVPHYNTTEDTNPTIIRIPSRYLPLDPEDRAMRWGEVFKLHGTLTQSNYDILHIQTPFIAHYVGVSLAKKLGIPRVETYHTYFEEYLYHYVPFLPKSWMKYVARRYTKTQCNDLNAVIVPSSAMKGVLQQYGVNTLTEVLPTGIELEKFQNGDGDKFRRNYNIPIDRPTLVFIGRVAFEKNIDFLLHVVAKVRQTIPEVLLLIAGEGPSLSHLKHMAKNLHLNDNVLFLGYLDRKKELLDCYACGDAFVFASNTETQGLVLLEAMALGVPVVSTAVMGTKDILAAKKGALVCNESIDEFADGVITLLADKQLREKLSKEALEYVKTWSARSMAEKLVSFYERVIHHHS